MSILIKGAAMPSCCEVCPLNYDYYRCNALGDRFDDREEIEFETQRLSDCPLVEAPSDNVTEDIDKTLEKYTICGYVFKDLAVFADACRKQGITETEMANFCRNATDAYNYIVEECQKQFDAVIIGEKEN